MYEIRVVTRTLRTDILSLSLALHPKLNQALVVIQTSRFCVRTVRVTKISILNRTLKTTLQ